MRTRHHARVQKHRQKAARLRRIAARFFYRGLLNIGLAYFQRSEVSERRAAFWIRHG